MGQIIYHLGNIYHPDNPAPAIEPEPVIDADEVERKRLQAEETRIICQITDLGEKFDRERDALQRPLWVRYHNLAKEIKKLEPKPDCFGLKYFDCTDPELERCGHATACSKLFIERGRS